MSSPPPSSSSTNPLTKIPLLISVFKFVFSSRYLKRAGKMVELSTVTSSWRETICVYEGAVLPYSYGLHQSTGVVHLEKLFMIACKKGFFWLVDTLVKAGIKRDQVTEREGKITGLTGLYQTLAHQKCVTNENYSSSEWRAIVEVLLSTEVIQMRSKRALAREAKAAAASNDKEQPLFFSPLYFCEKETNNTARSAFDLAIDRGLFEAFKLMFKMFLELKLKPFHQKRSAKEIRDKTEIQKFILEEKFHRLIRAASGRTKGHLQILEMMLNEDVYFADLELLHYRQNFQKITVLHHAASGLNAEGIKLILEHERKLTSHIPISERKCTPEQQKLLHFQDDALYMQKRSLLFMASGDGYTQKLPIFFMFSSPSWMSPGSFLHHDIMTKVFENNNLRPDDDPSPLFESFRVLVDAYRKNKHELFSDEELKTFVAPNRLPGMTEMKSNRSIFGEAARRYAGNVVYSRIKTQKERENHVFHKIARFLFTEPQRLGFDAFDINEYHCFYRTEVWDAIMEGQNLPFFELIFEFGGARLDRLGSTEFQSPNCHERMKFPCKAASTQRHLEFTFHHPKEQFLPLFPVLKTTTWKDLDPVDLQHLGPVLIFACLYASENVLGYFLKQPGADVNCIAPLSKLRPIHNAVKGYGTDNYKIFSKHLQEFAERTRPAENLFDVKTRDGVTPLMIACQEGRVSDGGNRLHIVEDLIGNRFADVKAVDNDGNSVLHYCFKRGQSDVETVKFLLQKCGCDPNQQNNKRQTPIQLSKGTESYAVLTSASSGAKNSKKKQLETIFFK